MNIQEFKEGQNLYIGDFGDELCNYTSGYIYEIIGYIAENHIYTNTDNLFDWAKENINFIEECVNEYGFDNKNFDFCRLIQSGQYYSNREELYNNLYDILVNFVFDYIENSLEITELNDEQIDELEYLFCGIDKNDRLEDIIEDINNIFNKEEE